MLAYLGAHRVKLFLCEAKQENQTNGGSEMAGNAIKWLSHAGAFVELAGKETPEVEAIVLEPNQSCTV